MKYNSVKARDGCLVNVDLSYQAFDAEQAAVTPTSAKPAKDYLFVNSLRFFVDVLGHLLSQCDCMVHPLRGASTLGDWSRPTLHDYHSSLVSAAGLLKPSLADDGVHPNAVGYKRMTDLADLTLRQYFGH